MYHFVWADQRERQGYKCDVSLKRGIQIICILENDASHATLYIEHNKTTIDCGFEFVNNIESINLNLVLMFPYKRATIDCGFEFVNNIESY